MENVRITGKRGFIPKRNRRNALEIREVGRNWNRIEIKNPATDRQAEHSPAMLQLLPKCKSEKSQEVPPSGQQPQIQQQVGEIVAPLRHSLAAPKKNPTLSSCVPQRTAATCHIGKNGLTPGTILQNSHSLGNSNSACHSSCMKDGPEAAIRSRRAR